LADNSFTHLDPNRESHLQEILARKSPLPVKTVTEHQTLQAGVVFVVSANWQVNSTAEVYSSQKGGAGVQVCLPLRNGGG